MNQNTDKEIDRILDVYARKVTENGYLNADFVKAKQAIHRLLIEARLDEIRQMNSQAEHLVGTQAYQDDYMKGWNAHTDRTIGRLKERTEALKGLLDGEKHETSV